MIVFKHCVTDWSNLLLECSGHYGERGSSLPCAAASALMASALRALQLRKAPRLEAETADGHVKIRCKYTRETAEIAMVTICGFQWLAEQAPDAVKCERIRAPKKKSAE